MLQRIVKMAKSKATYENNVQELDTILQRLDNSETPIDLLAADVKTGVKLIKELSTKLKSVELEVNDAFQELENIA